MFHVILEDKNDFLDYKNNNLKKRIDWDFSKGLIHGFGPKLEIFQSLYFRQNRPGKHVLRCF